MTVTHKHVLAQDPVVNAVPIVQLNVMQAADIS